MPIVYEIWERMNFPNGSLVMLVNANTDISAVNNYESILFMLRCRTRADQTSLLTTGVSMVNNTYQKYVILLWCHQVWDDWAQGQPDGINSKRLSP